MDFFSNHLLSLLLAVPALGALAVTCAPWRRAVRWTAVGTAGITLVLAALLPFLLDIRKAAPYDYAIRGGIIQLVERSGSLPLLHVQYLVGLDGLSLPAIFLVGLMFALACLEADKNEEKPFFARMLLLESALLGTLLSLDLLLFWFFFCAAAGLARLLVRRRVLAWERPADVRFAPYALASAGLLFVVVIGARVAFGSTDLVAISRAIGGGGPGFASHALFVAASIAFLIRMAAPPFHTWWTDAAAEASAPAILVLPLVLLTGGFGMLRVALPMFPQAAMSSRFALGALGIFGLIHGALCILAQPHFRKLGAYVVTGQAGLFLIGVAATSAEGAGASWFVAVASCITGATLLSIAACSEGPDGGHGDVPRDFALSGPPAGGLVALALLAAGGAPLSCGFVGTTLVILAAFASAAKNPSGAGRGAYYVIGVAACIGAMLNASAAVWTLRRLRASGTDEVDSQNPPRGQHRGFAFNVLLAGLSIVLGVLPWPLFFSMTSATMSALAAVHPSGGQARSVQTAAPGVSVPVSGK